MKKSLMTVALALGIGLTVQASAATIDDAGRDALFAALADEHHAEAFYDAVIAKFGDVRPFVNIIEAERMHAAEIGAVMASYGLTAGPNDQLGSKAISDAVPATIAEACKIGVEAELVNRTLYDGELIPAVSTHPDIVALFERLRDASNNNHLPAFERCAAR